MSSQMFTRRAVGENLHTEKSLGKNYPNRPRNRCAGSIPWTCAIGSPPWTHETLTPTHMISPLVWVKIIEKSWAQGPREELNHTSLSKVCSCDHCLMISGRMLRPAEDPKPVLWVWLPILFRQLRTYFVDSPSSTSVTRTSASIGDLMWLWVSMKNNRKKTTPSRSSHLLCRTPLRYPRTEKHSN